MTRTVVVLGAGLAGLPIAHYLLRRTSTHHEDLRVVLVSPHDTFYWKIASVRFALPDQMDEEKYMFPLAEQFASYAAEKFELVIGAAETLDPEQNTVGVRVGDGDGELRTLDYHTLVVATGSRYRDDMPWKEVGTTAQTRASLARLRARIRDARSIVVAGAGITGVEFAGELGSRYAKSGLKEVTLIGAEALPLEKRVKENVRRTAKNELDKLNVKFIGGAKVAAQGDVDVKDAKTITLTHPDGSSETLVCDLVVPTFGVVPNTSFAPEGMRDEASGCLKQGNDLRAPGYKNIFVLGDAGNLQPAQAANTDTQTRHLMTQFNAYFSDGEIRPYTFDPNRVQLVLTIGRDRGTGQAGSLKLWSPLVWYLKGRHLGTDSADAYARGDSGGMGGAWPK
ncbi:putative FAD binding protein [Xylaria digitata]|nr:putative FAD binding protein [Xylaria digitata]